MKGPLPLGEEHRRCRWEQTKPETNTCTNQTDTDQGIGTRWRAMEESGGKGDSMAKTERVATMHVVASGSNCGMVRVG